ncbi:MAG: hypothetical protein GC160_24290 [Acidobacteria bacterium]|nr:hypothetical protein [Acidobacteriota bacterium]
MKLRLKGDTIRLRLTQGEVARLMAEGCVEESTRVGSSALRYGLRRDPDLTVLEADFRDGCIEVRVPAAQASRWGESGEEGIREAVRSRDGSVTKVLIEKDFACLKPRGGEDEDCFPNPAGACASFLSKSEPE